ncbi:sulfotransferase [Billgrantia gudaonensis]|uniref:Probable UDP-N-acetylglucosamine--peptide N-acetylglucosaminyltransferase SPINDLY n=1 Tax=Billgrantia gudaonensis TaxID=376427 RepID=A0A1G8SZL0_9GAMM|nr:sulfotransferase [Halomonas gudaonensis]SDJ34583.1 Predicted O-linked N-acetylglucosamine transferase, SPINDLY family [Halomonas gudaonensis]
MARKKTRQKQSVRKSSAKRTSPAPNRMPRHADLGVPKPEVDHFMALYKAKRLSEAEREAQAMTERYPESAFAWKALGTTLLEDGRVEPALKYLHRSVELDDSDPLSLTSLSAVYYQQGDNEQAVRYQSRAVDLQPDYAPAQYRLAEMLQMAGKHFKALEHAKKAQELGYDDFRSRVLVGALLYQTKYFSEALVIYEQLEKDYPGSAPVYNNLGNLYKDIGQYELSEVYYKKALDAQPSYVMAYSNIFFAKHYNPNASQQEIIEFAKGWDQHFALAEMPAPDSSRDVAKPLRVGMISSGFRIHPVGQMIATALEHSRPDIHFYAYATNDYDDYVTQKIRESTRVWRPVRHLSQEALAQQIRDDAIDILIDLSGHGDGNCLQAISMRPAPLCIKWVGGLVNTMGLSSIDYLLSDSIETPEGVDDQYTEKLIRLPDDYICYMPCPYAPNTSSLPAIKNGYITLGCLNNPAKIGERLLAEWARLMLELPESRLLLRGAQYESEDFCRGIRETLGEQGIEEYRIILEGPARHQEFLETYQRIDIALDTWPYSGGLTTCEAMLMGVPVVTLPGPTFAGRHSATHLINAGLQELVASNWEEYRQRVLELANDLPNLAVIRAGLRTILHYSPVCDAPRFANHFNNALRAVWVRYCEGKEPEALTFNKEGELWFEDDKQPIELPEARSEEEVESESFEWQLDEPITIIDNAAVLPRHPDYPKWMASGHLAVISFDPASLLNNRVEKLQEYGELHHYPHALLGDGHPATLYATLDAEKGSTLRPLPEDLQPEYLRDKLKVLTELSINTVALDQIEGLPSVDMLVLDDLHDAMKVLENGEQTLKNTLLLQMKVSFQPTHERQPSLAEMQHWAIRNGFRFYRFNNEYHRNYLPESVPIEKRQACELVSAEAIFLPSHQRLSKLSSLERKKLAFFLDTVLGYSDIAYFLMFHLGSQGMECIGISEVERNSLALSRSGCVPNVNPEEQCLSLEEIERLAGESSDDEHCFYHYPYNSEYFISNKSSFWNSLDIVFVVGCGHSGTTLISSILSNHPDIYCLPYESEAFINGNSYSIILDYAYKEIYDSVGAEPKVVVEKTPRHIHEFDRISRLFPKARFIVPVRDGRDVAYSINKRIGSLREGISRWVRDNYEVSRIKDSSNVFFYRHEDLVDAPDKTMEEMLRFIGVEYVPELANAKRENKWRANNHKDRRGLSDSLIKKRNNQIRSKLYRNTGEWREGLSPVDISFLEGAFNKGEAFDLMREFGYF